MMAVLLGLIAFLLFILVLATPIRRALVGWLVIVVGGMLLLAVYLTWQTRARSKGRR